ncbi:MAG: hypothetical protein ACI83H_000559 [Glaciecola sp.]|jgi:hypothetical protein
MIKFFSKIRYSLIEQNKSGKYFKYTIGEIILVVIGVLIALSINNWNENRKNSIKEIQFLEGFKNDLMANKTELNRVVKKAKITSNLSDSILKLKRRELDSLGIKSFVRFMMDATGFTVYQTQEGTIQGIMGSGNLDVISNDSIRLAIGSWQANLKDVREWEELDKNSSAIYNEYLENHVKLYTRGQEELPLDEFKMSMLLNDNLFLNRIATQKRFPKILNDLYRKKLLN